MVSVLVSKTCSPEIAQKIKKIWNRMVHEFLQVDFVRQRPFGSSYKIRLGFEISSDLSLAGLSDVVSWFGARAGARTESFSPYALYEAAFTDGWEKFIVYGHTHHYEIVPLRSVQKGDETVDTL